MSTIEPNDYKKLRSEINNLHKEADEWLEKDILIRKESEIPDLQNEVAEWTGKTRYFIEQARTEKTENELNDEIEELKRKIKEIEKKYNKK